MSQLSHSKPHCLCVRRFVTFERDSSVEQVFQVGSMHELSGKRVEVKSATPRGSGPVAGRGSLAEQRMWGPRSTGGRGMGSFPGQISHQGFGMGGYGAVGWASCQNPFVPHVIIPLLLYTHRLHLSPTISCLLILHMLASKRHETPAEASMNVSVLASLVASNTAVH